MESADRVERDVRAMSYEAGPELNEDIWADAAGVYDRQQEKAPVSRWSLGRKQAMNSPRMRLTAAALIVAAVGIGLVGTWHGGPVAYAFEQTIEAMRGKQSFHIQTYFSGHPHDEFWAEYDIDGRILRYRQEESAGRDAQDPVVTLWEGQVRTKYFPLPMGVCLITNTGNTEPELEDFEPETAAEEVFRLVEAGHATLEIQEATPNDGLITVTATHTNGQVRYVLLIDAETKFVTRAVTYYWDNDEETEYSKGIEVLQYNEALDPSLFQADFPEEAIIIDQVMREVGMAQGDLTDEEVASEIVRQALEAWAVGDYVEAGRLFGGAPPELFTRCYAHIRPEAIVAIDEPVPVSYIKPLFKVTCWYETDESGVVETIELTFNVLPVDAQPGRWYVRHGLKL